MDRTTTRRNNGLTDATQTGNDRQIRRHAGLLISPSVIGSANRGRVLQALFDLGPTSRAALARHAGVNRATISGIVQPLLDQGLLSEHDPLPAAGTGGKPARPVWFSSEARPIGAVLLLHNLVRTALITLGGEILSEQSAEIRPGATRVDPFVRALNRCLAKTLAGSHRPPLGIGIAVGGMVDTDRGVIVKVNLAPGLDGYPLGEEINRRFHLPVTIDHHPRAMLVGDRWFGQGRGLRNFATIYTGEVLGAAFYLDGRLHRGADGTGGEIGHTFVQVDGELCRCGRRGCWETIATVGWLRRESKGADLPGADEMTAAALVKLADAGVAEASALLDRYAHNVAVGIANLQQTIAPKTYVLHGDVAGGGEQLRDRIAAHVHELVPPRPGNDVSLMLGGLGHRAALRGAAGLVLSEQLAFPL